MVEIKLKNAASHKWERYGIPTSIDAFLHYRGICFLNFRRYLEAEKNTQDHGRMGFTPATFTEWWLQKAGIALPNGFDRMILLYACYQKVRYMDKEGNWKELKNIYTWPK